MWNAGVNATELAKKVQNALPGGTAAECLRLALLLAVHHELDDADDAAFAAALADVQMRLRSANDQYSAVAHELANVAKVDPRRFVPEQLWALVRSIKVHSRLVALYTGSSLKETMA